MGNQIIQSIKTIAQSLVDNAGYDKTRGGFIVGVNSVTNTYSVKIDGITYPIVRAVDDATYNIGDVVKVVIPCNQATQMYISSSVLSDDSTGNKVANAVGLAQEAKQLGLNNQADISNAAKVATNYIHSDSTNGLVVNNNKTVGVGYDIQLKADGANTGMNIRQDGDILASFLPNQVSLGKNSINSKVAMCGGKGGVSASFGYYVDSVSSNNAEMGSTLDFDFNETTFKNKVGQEVGFYDFSYTSVDGWTLFDPVNDTSYAVTLSQYGITLRTATSSLNDHAQIVINYVLDGSVKFYNADISNPVRKLELEMAENPSSSESDYANITIERQSGTYANGDGKEHSIITMMTLHEFANVSTLQLFDDEISLNATHVALTSTHGEGAIQLNGDTYINGNLVVQGDNLVSKIQDVFCTSYNEALTITAGTFTNNGCSATLVGNSLRLNISAKAKSAITAGNITNQKMLTIKFTDSRISLIYAISGSGGTSGPNSQMSFGATSSGGQHTITVTLAAIAQNIASGGEINAYVALPCELNWDAY